MTTYALPNVRFIPWIGEDYSAGYDGLRTLVLGEAHYDPDTGEDVNANPKFTVECIEEQIEGELTRKFWTNIAIAFTGRGGLTCKDKRSFWSKVAFYNFIQECAADGPRIAPAPEAWRRSDAGFRDVINALRPQFIVGLGYRMFDNLPDFGGRYGPDLKRSPSTSTWLYPCEDSQVLLWCMRHPSSGFSGTVWHEHIAEARAVALQLVS